jgi:hypothetical protein
MNENHADLKSALETYVCSVHKSYFYEEETVVFEELITCVYAE